MLEFDSLRQLPDTLIQARIAAGLTQQTLAQRLGVDEQQVERYEASRYAGVSLDRVIDVADALGVKIEGTGIVNRQTPSAAGGELD